MMQRLIEWLREANQADPIDSLIQRCNIAANRIDFLEGQSVEKERIIFELESNLKTLEKLKNPTFLDLIKRIFE